MNLKKSFLGGYNKASVNELIEEHNKQIDTLREKESALTDTVANKISEIANLSTKVDEMRLEIEKLTTENDALKIEANKNHLIFENIAKIYERAYGAGHDVVLDSKTHSEQMIDRMTQLFIEASNNVDETIAKQNNLKQEFTSLYEKVNSLVTELTNSTNALFKGAEEYISVFDVFKDIKTTTEARAETHLKEFEDFASEFLTAEEIKKAETFTVISNNNVASPVIEEEQAISHTIDDKQITLPITQSEDISVEPNETSLSQPQETDETVLLHEDELEDEIFNTIVREKITTPTNIETKVTSAQEANTPIAKPQEFTQFGRKSRVSSASREELIRKALLKTGGM
jgi:phage shock protein A